MSTPEDISHTSEQHDSSDGKSNATSLDDGDATRDEPRKDGTGGYVVGIPDTWRVQEESKH